MKLLSILFLLLISVGSHARENVVGCYSVQATVNSKGVAARIDEKSIRLTSTASSTPWSGKVFQVVPAVASEHISYHSAFWFEDKAKVVVTFSDNGLSGVRLTLHHSPEGFEGTMERYWDFQNPTDERKVSLRRKPCESFH